MKKQKYDVAAYVWPSYTGDEPRTLMFWPEGYGEWQTVKAAKAKFPGHVWPRKPLWGYVNEADPYVMQMQIDAAADHGVNVFIYDWYWFDNRPFLEQCLDNGYLKAKNNDRVKFYIMWANHVATTVWDKRTAHLDIPIWDFAVSPAVFRTICERMIDMYFLHPSYYKINGKPVFMFHDLRNFIVGIGGLENAKRGLYEFQNLAIKAGLPGVHIQDCLRSKTNMGYRGADLGFDGTVAEAVNKLGFDSTTHYQFCVKEMEYPQALAQMLDVWDDCRETYKIPYFPLVALGWDPNPRFETLREDVMTDVTPDNVKKAFMAAKNYIDSHPELPAPLTIVNSWNEWTETSYLEPDDINGYAFLQAVKEVFCGE